MNDDTPICPICGEECEEIFFDKEQQVCGCDRCVSSRDAWEWMWEQQDEEERIRADYYLDYMKDMRIGN